ncbi:hypothetical protein ACS0PU_005678 [Formica fusca]
MAPIKGDARDRFRRNEFSELSHMEQLAKWIVNVRRKKLECHKTLKRDLRMEAVLTHALRNAEYEYRAKQLSRVSRWRRLRGRLLKDVEYGSCGLYNAAEHREVEKQHNVSKRNKLSQESWRDELNSLDNFLQQLGQIKSIVQR